MLQLLTRLYRAYNYYISPDKFLVRRAIRQLFRPQRRYDKALEIGAGIATLTQYLKAHADISDYLTSDVDESDTADVVCDAQAMPFEDGSYDLVVSFEVMEHLPDPEAFISETARVLKDGGDAMLTLPFMYGRHDFADFHRWTELGLRRIFERHGMEVKRLIKRGGTGLACSRLLANFIHDRVAAGHSGWRARRSSARIIYGLMTIVLLPVNLLSWCLLVFDLIFDRNSANALGFVVLARKTPRKT